MTASTICGRIEYLSRRLLFRCLSLAGLYALRRPEIKTKASDSKNAAEIICQAAENKQAEDICLIEIAAISQIADYLIICTANSKPHLKAISDEIDRRLKKGKWDGTFDSNWIVLDYGNIIVHILGKEERAYYKLEDLWGKSAVIYHL